MFSRDGKTGKSQRKTGAGEGILKACAKETDSFAIALPPMAEEPVGGDDSVMGVGQTESSAPTKHDMPNCRGRRPCRPAMVTGQTEASAPTKHLGLKTSHFMR
jgi:hypothetical protein